MKNKIMVFGLASVLTMGTTVGVFAKDQKDLKVAITEEAAKKIAVDSVTNGTFIEIELEDEDDVVVYEVDVKSGDVTHEIEVDSNTGTILKDEIEEDEDDDDEDEVINVDVKLTENEAIEIAKKSLGGKGEVTEVELEKEDGVIIYDIEIRLDNKEFDLEVDANTGQIISQEEDLD